MGLTEFDGFFVIQPTLPVEITEAVNDICAYRNNAYGDGDLNSFDAVVHHLHGRPKERTWAMYKSKKDGTSKTPSVWCHWRLLNQRVSSHNSAQQTILEWDREERFNDYMYWAQYLIDFITLLAEKQYGIKIKSFSGKITWDGVYDNGDQGMLCVVPRQELEITGFYPDDFLPLATPASSLHHMWRDDQLESAPPPKGKPFLSRFAVEAHVEPNEPMEFARRADMELDQGVSRGGYVLCLDTVPANNSTVVFHLHHEKSHVIFCSQDPLLYDKRKALEDPSYLQQLAIVDRKPTAQVGLSTPPISPDSPIIQQGTTMNRCCVECKNHFSGPANRLAAYCWPHGYADAYVLAIYCSQCTQ
ncbi:hypothetical protein K492DRAFT_178869 [Lichtheimia hyalospora FSU 10163]|nr:hypothetical protein K492DRAFT_178869 [Lichtheimia hyalospora FSU 10163]